MKIAVAGKGGSGKTTLAGTLARLLARTGWSGLLAIDADSNPNLAVTLGIASDEARSVSPIPRSVLTRVTDPDGKARAVLAEEPDAIVNRYGVPAADGVRLLLMGRVDHAGAG